VEDSVGAEFLSTEEIAKRKGFSVTFIKKAAKQFGLPHYKFGRLLKFKESDFDEWAKQRQQVG
jgi:excisionase family DNA binding protein